mmetsp:Transcript_52259/g.131191  ORF Transcript_52259/g.131191 Transcript_52259/m.131191 type:complete len:499 (-) Transcript_52259:143-1639(-)|eukprot:CAMPEP_0177669266 /NCGR_PEP_ID=MMETSP0447-20121125/23329_1 /TAXON_ID=0 /ORGANISM="Stygamoeba regulata, Strain BSH-02190019" /LENGTH=498 /DNA_ID=CAMNT_0019176081 /DNA_START=111 /DNA_END=1607 /DNA_ORIENTATION=-
MARTLACSTVALLLLVIQATCAASVPEDGSYPVQIGKAIAELTNSKYNNSCFWGGPKGMEYGILPWAQPIQFPVLFPDQGSTYFVAQFYLPEGAILKIQGAYPNERYFSFTIAHYSKDGALGGGDNLRDVNVNPDEGSTNPFLPDNNRLATSRNYTIYVVQGNPPSQRPPNTVYTCTSDPLARIHLSMRNYIPDVGFDGLGQPLDDMDGLPRVTLLQPNAAPLTGEAMCKAVKASKEAEGGEFPPKLWEKLLASSDDAVNAPAKPTPVWELFWNIDYSVVGDFIADPATRVREHPATSDGGFANNPDTHYLTTSLSLKFGPVVVIQGKLPAHATTKNHDKHWRAGTQLRYWSVCTGGAPPSGAGWDCTFDEAVPVDEDGMYTLVVSRPEDRPANAREECGVKWLDFGAGEGVGTGRGHFPEARSWVNFVYMRYQVTNPTWPKSPSNVPEPTPASPFNQEQWVMREYYPVAHYETREQFELHGCKRRALSETEEVLVGA